MSTNNEGMTIRQFKLAKFFKALDEYKAALRSKHNIVITSIHVHAAKSGVPKELWPLVGRAFRESK